MYNNMSILHFGDNENMPDQKDFMQLNRELFRLLISIAFSYREIILLIWLSALSFYENGF